MSKLVKLAKEAGPGGVWSGLGTRIVMTAALVGGQFLIYGESAMMAMLAVIDSVVQVSDAPEIVPRRSNQDGAGSSAWCNDHKEGRLRAAWSCVSVCSCAMSGIAAEPRSNRNRNRNRNCIATEFCHESEWCRRFSRALSSPSVRPPRTQSHEH